MLSSESLRQLTAGLTGSAWFNEFLTTMTSGGVSMWVLFALGLLLWYCIAARLALLGTGSSAKTLNTLRNMRGEYRLYGIETRLNQRGLLARAALDASQARAFAEHHRASTRHFVDAAILHHRMRLRHYSTTIKTIVIIAPLIGLLGTIIGMIETFEALQTLAIFSQGSSIAGGISKALYTTQMGLIIGVPGLLIGRILDRRQQRLTRELDQVKSLVMSQVQT